MSTVSLQSTQTFGGQGQQFNNTQAVGSTGPGKSLFRRSAPLGKKGKEAAAEADVEEKQGFFSKAWGFVRHPIKSIKGLFAKSKEEVQCEETLKTEVIEKEREFEEWELEDQLRVDLGLICDERIPYNKHFLAPRVGDRDLFHSLNPQYRLLALLLLLHFFGDENIRKAEKELERLNTLARLLARNKEILSKKAADADKKATRYASSGKVIGSTSGFVGMGLPVILGLLCLSSYSQQISTSVSKFMDGSDAMGNLAGSGYQCLGAYNRAEAEKCGTDLSGVMQDAQNVTSEIQRLYGMQSMLINLMQQVIQSNNELSRELAQTIR